MGALQLIKAETEMRTDVMAKSSAIDYDVDQGGKLQAVVKGSHYGLTPHSEGQIYSRTGVPKMYADKLMGLKEGELLKENLRTMTRRTMEDGVLVRRVGTVVKGWLSPSYKRMDGSILFETFIDKVTKNGLVPYRGMNTDYRYQVSFIYPKVFTPAKNEAVTYGMSLMTGDYGDQSVELSMMVLRIICANLAIGLEMLRKIHLGARFKSEEEMIDFSRQTLELDGRTVASAIGDVVDTGSKKIEYLDKKIREASSKEVGKDQLKGALQDLRRKGIGKELTEKVGNLFNLDDVIELLPAGKSEWRLSNAISLVAQSAKSQDVRVDMEKSAMDILLN